MESCNRGAATLAEGARGNGSAEPSEVDAFDERCATAVSQEKNAAANAAARINPADILVILTAFVR
jgi:hypothetical protein